MADDYHDVPTSELTVMWERERARLLGKEDAVIADYDSLLAMRRELDKRKDERKPVVDVNFADDYLTD